MAKEKKIKKYKLPPESDQYAAYNKPDEESDFAYTVVTTNGKPKTLLWSIAAFVIAILSVALGFLGWPGLILGIIGLILSIVAWNFLGFFNRFIIISLIASIFGSVMSIAFIVADNFNLF